MVWTGDPPLRVYEPPQRSGAARPGQLLGSGVLNPVERVFSFDQGSRTQITGFLKNPLYLPNFDLVSSNGLGRRRSSHAYSDPPNRVS